jgi:hypothetical protein
MDINKTISEGIEDFINHRKSLNELSSEYSESSMKEFLNYIIYNVNQEDKDEYIKDFIKQTIYHPISNREHYDGQIYPILDEKIIQAFSFDNSNLKLIKISNSINKLEITNDGRILLNGVLFFDNIKLQESLKFLTKPSKIKKSNKVVDELKKLEIFS